MSDSIQAHGEESIDAPANYRLGSLQRGVAAVEFAVILPLLIILLTFPVFFGRVFMHYSVAQKAAHDAARYLASIPLVEMTSQTRSGAAATIARQIATTELEELNPGSGSNVYVDVLCDGFSCGFATPTVITVSVRMRMFDDFFNDFTWEAVGNNGIPLQAIVSVPYVGD